jgi:hypothetical protein
MSIGLILGDSKRSYREDISALPWPAGDPAPQPLVVPAWGPKADLFADFEAWRLWVSSQIPPDAAAAWMALPDGGAWQENVYALWCREIGREVPGILR